MFRSAMIVLGVSIFVCAIPVRAAEQRDTPAAETTFTVGGHTIRILTDDDHVIRVTRAPGKRFDPDKSLAVIAVPNEAAGVDTTDSMHEVRTTAIKARLDLNTGLITFLDVDGNTILQERRASFAPHTVAGERTTRVRQRFFLPPGEAIFGLGQHPDGRWDYRGGTVHLQQENKHIGVPMLVSSGGYGLLWDNPSVTDVHVGTAGAPDVLTWDSEAGDAVDYYFMYGPSVDEVIRGYRKLTGEVPMWGRWAFGYWQCRERYKTQEEILSVAREYRRRRIPIDGIIQDWQYWYPHPWGSHAFGENFPDPDAMMKELHAANFHAIISVWSKFDKGSSNYDDMEAAGHLFDQVYPNVWPKGESKWFDPFHPSARRMFWDQISRQIFAHGLDGWWLDATEPELSGNWGEMRELTTAAGPGYRVYNAYPLLVTTAVYEGQRAERNDKRVFILTRSAYSGMQRNAAAAWSGDIDSDWHTLKNQVPAGLNFVLTGIPYWNTDIGGFFSRSPDDPDYRECYTRWFQFGSFCPMFRSHGTNAKKEMWQFGPDTERILVAYDNLRYRLLPYIYSVAWQVTSQASTMMRPLLMDYPHDEQAIRTPDQFLFGPSIMVCPVTEPAGGSGEVIPASNLVDREGRVGGLSATYFQGREFDMKRLERRDATISFNWEKTKREGVGENSHRDPLPGMEMNHFSARWDGAVLTREAGEYVFECAADDGMRVWVDGRLIIDDWAARAVVTRTARITLPAHTRVPIKVEYFQYAGAAVLELRWKPPQAIDKRPTRNVYLPAGNDWYDFWTGAKCAGGTTIDAAAPIETMPLYVRAGSIVPMGPLVQHAAEPCDPIELRVYRGRDARFALYEDAGDGYGYEQGAYAVTPLTWDESASTLAIGPRKGAYEGMPSERTYHVVFVQRGFGIGADTTSDGRVVTLRGDRRAQVKPGIAITEPVTLTIRADKSGKPISSHLFGIFYEDINYAADGGLYAELVQNRSFEYRPTARPDWTATTAWQLLKRGGAQGYWRVDDSEPIHPNNPRYLVVHVQRAGNGVGLLNRGFDGMAVEAGHTYDFAMVARQLYMDRRWGSNPDLTGRPQPVVVRLEDEGGKALGELSLSVAGRSWQRLHGSITAKSTTAHARLVILFRKKGGVAVDMISLFPRDTFRGRRNGHRKDLAETIAALRPRFVRFPGGCLVHGDGLGNMYRWKNTIGPIETRRDQRNIWGYHQTAGLGYFEYFQFCEDIGAEPLPIVPAAVCCQNAGQVAGIGQRGLPMTDMPAYVQEVLDLVEWANGPASSTWGAKRAAAGHPEPFNLKYVGVGNEDHITPVFKERFKLIHDAIVKRYPDITVVGTVGPGEAGEDFDAGWAFAKKTNLAVVDEHFYKPPQWFWDNLQRYDNYDRSGPQVYVGEYAAHDDHRRATLRSALAEAAFLTSLERNGDVVTMASYAPLLGKVGNTQWDPDLIYFDNSEVAPTVNYYVQQLFSRHAGDEYLPTAVESTAACPHFAASSVRDSQSGDIIVKLVNGDAATRAVTLRLLGTDGKKLSGKRFVLTHPDPMAIDSLDRPNTVTPTESTIKFASPFETALPPYSLTVIRIEKGK